MPRRHFFLANGCPRMRNLGLLIFMLLAFHQPAYGFPIPAWMGMPESYVCRWVDQAPTIDGKLNDSVWKSAEWTNAFTDIEGPLKPAPTHNTICAMLWDDQFFYIAARLVEPHVNASLTERDAVIYHDNDFEVFIDPDGDNHLYYELEINALNTVWDLLLVRPYRDGAPAVNAWDIQGLQTAVSVDGTLNDPSDTDDGWNVEIAIPWNVLAQCAGRPSPPESGHIWRVNFSRVQWQFDANDGRYEKRIDPITGQIYPENNWVWSPQGLIAMHYPENWGEVLFVGPQLHGQETRTIQTNTEHASINIARALMDVYYAQKTYHEKYGFYAQTPRELENDYGVLMKKWTTEIETTEGFVFVLPYQWTFEMEATGDRFMATLDTPAGLITVNEEGRLVRNPLQPPEDCQCLYPEP